MKFTYTTMIYICVVLIIILFIFTYILTLRNIPNINEGFNVKDLSKISKGISKVGNVADEIPEKLKQMEKNIAAQTTDIIGQKFKSVFAQLGTIFDDGLVRPLNAVFAGIGSIFMQLFLILKTIGIKIITIPLCIIPFIIKETSNIFGAIHKAIVPRVIRPITQGIYDWSIGLIFWSIGWIIGWQFILRKCYSFNIGKNISAISNMFVNIDKNFKRDFGKLNFNKIKI